MQRAPSSAGSRAAYFASFKGGVFPTDFIFNISVFILCMVILGGMGNVWGVILGACLLAYLDQEGIANVGRLDELETSATKRSNLTASTSSGSTESVDRDHHAAPAPGPDPERAPPRRVHERASHDEPLMDVTA